MHCFSIGWLMRKNPAAKDGGWAWGFLASLAVCVTANVVGGVVYVCVVCVDCVCVVCNHMD